jgi:hypothetical protein
MGIVIELNKSFYYQVSNFSPKLSVVIPVFNEIDTISVVVDKVMSLPIVWEMIEANSHLILLNRTT